MARRRHSNRRRRRGSFSFLYKLLSTLAICGVVIVALTLFFRVETVVITGEERYTEKELLEATGIQTGDNLYLLLNKNEVARSIQGALPYVESVRINRKLPDTLLIEVTECGTPMAVIQDGSAWLVSPKGMIVEQLPASDAKDFAVIDGCALLAPSVGTPVALASEYAAQQSSLLALLAALEEAEMLEQTDAIHLDDLATLTMDYAGRFSVQLTYGADYPRKLKTLRLALDSGVIQDNMTGTFDMRRENGKTNFIPEAR